VTVATLLFSLVILALPVAVIGSTFGQVWESFDSERRKDMANLRNEKVFVTSTIQRLDPTSMSKLMFIEVWNHQGSGSEDSQEALQCQYRGTGSTFMGEATIELDLLDTRVVKQYKMPLGANNEWKRHVSGHITVRYEWTPSALIDRTKGESDDQHSPEEAPPEFEVRGQLEVTIVSAEQLINLDFARQPCVSSPYCTVMLYPNSPGPDQDLKPHIWRTETRRETLCPQWNASHVCNFNWEKTNVADHVEAWIKKRPAKERAGSKDTESSMVDAEAGKMMQVLSMLQEVGAELERTKGAVQILKRKVDRLSPMIPVSHQSSQQSVARSAPCSVSTADSAGIAALDLAGLRSCDTSRRASATTMT